MVEVLTDFDTTVAAVQYVAQNVRGGTVTVLVPGRLAQWDGVQITPGVSESPSMSMWIVGVLNKSKLQQKSVMVRKGWWTLYIPNYFGVATRVQTFRVPKIVDRANSSKLL